MLLGRIAKRQLAGLLTGILLCPIAAFAQSLHGCTDLEEARHPSFEGLGGVFFQLDPDLLNFNRISDASVAAIASLSAALKTRGTNLIFAPLPTKALAMPDHLGPEAAKFGYQPDVAAAIFDDGIARLKASGVSTLNLRRVLASPEPALPIHKADPRLTQAGTKALAQAIAGVIPDLGTPWLQSNTTGQELLSSFERQILQLHCQAPLPELKIDTLHLTQIPDQQPVEASKRIVVAGSIHTSDPSLFLDGFLQENLAAEVLLLPPGDATQPIAAYLTSDGFQESPPEYLIWITPVWQNLFAHGDQPLRELVAAARNECEELPVDRTTGETIRSETLANLEPAKSVMALAPGVPAKLSLHFEFENDRRLTKTITREEDVGFEGRFFQPLTGLPSGPATIEVASDPTSPTKLYLCEG